MKWKWLCIKQKPNTLTGRSAYVPLSRERKTPDPLKFPLTRPSFAHLLAGHGVRSGLLFRLEQKIGAMTEVAFIGC